LSLLLQEKEEVIYEALGTGTSGKMMLVMG